jgi:hypothetical protein
MIYLNNIFNEIYRDMSQKASVKESLIERHPAVALAIPRLGIPWLLPEGASLAALSASQGAHPGKQNKKAAWLNAAFEN